MARFTYSLSGTGPAGTPVACTCAGLDEALAKLVEFNLGGVVGVTIRDPDGRTYGASEFVIASRAFDDSL